MDSSEQLVHEYLKRCGFSSVVYEPDGNVPPDFVADGRVAVEVRRLNQSYTSSEGHTRDLEEIAIPTWQRMKRLLPTIGAAQSLGTWFVSFHYQRPFGKWSSIEPKVKAALTDFLKSPTDQPTELQIADNFSVDMYKASRSHGSNFILGGATDNDAGGFILAETRKNIRRCSDEKETKIEAYRAKYPEWWLVLPDHIGLGVSAEDQPDYRRLLVFPHRWDRIVLLDPRGKGQPFAI